MPHQLLRKLKAIQRRLQWIEFCRRFLWSAALTEGLLLAFLVAGRLTTLPIEFESILIWSLPAMLALALAWSWIARVRLLEAAMRADERLGLKERLSSAFLIRQPRTEAELAVVEDAAKCAESIQPGRQFPAELKRELKWAGAPIAALALAWWLMPQFDVFASKESVAAKEAEKRAPLEIKAEPKKELAKELEKLAAQLDKSPEAKQTELAKAIEKDLNQLAKQIEEHKIDQEKAMAKMSKMGDKVADRQQELEKKLEGPKNLQAMGEGKITKEMAKDLEKGNFEKAVADLKNLEEKLKKGDLSEQEKKSLEKELKAMAGKLGPNSELGKSLAKAAEKMEAGQTAEALAQMQSAAAEMKNMQGLMQEIKQLDALKAELASANKSLGKPDTQTKGKQGGQGQQGQKQGDGKGQQGDKQASKQGKNSQGNSAESAQGENGDQNTQGKQSGQGQGKDDESSFSEMESGDGQGNKPGEGGQSPGEGEQGQGGDSASKGTQGQTSQWEQKEVREYGSGSGSGGIGDGHKVDKADGPSDFIKKQVKGQLSKGRILARMKVPGEQTPGEATTQYEEMRMNYEQKAEDTIKNEVMPLEYKSLVRDYFDAIKSGKSETKKEGAAGSPAVGAGAKPPSAPAAAPAKPSTPAAKP